jgi:hypothetical protein
MVLLQTAKAVTELYKGLQRFAVTIECMMGQSGCKHIVKRLKNKKKNQKPKKAMHHHFGNHHVSPKRMALLQEIKEQLSNVS